LAERFFDAFITIRSKFSENMKMELQDIGQENRNGGC